MEGGATKQRRFSWVLVEAALVGLGLVLLAGAVFYPLQRYAGVDVHVVDGVKMQTGWNAYLLLAGYLAGVGALFHLLFELFGWNRRYCVTMF